MALRQTQGKTRLVLIDGHAILHRAYHAFPKNLITRKGEMVNAVYGFTRILLKVIDDLRPTYLVVAFDLPQPTFRQKIFVAYQYKRPAMDEELKGQIERVKEVVRAFKIPIFEKAGFEADDVIATLAKQAGQRQQIEILIITGDKDFAQLVTKKIKLYLPTMALSDGRAVGEKEIEGLLGVKPKQVIDFKALVGDSSDNYSGVLGIGPKTAGELLAKYGDLKTIYKNLSEIKPSVARKLAAGKESAFLSQQLAKIVTNVPVKLNFKACRFQKNGQEKARELFEKLEFRSLLNKLPGKQKKKDKQMTLL